MLDRSFMYIVPWSRCYEIYGVTRIIVKKFGEKLLIKYNIIKNERKNY